MTSHTAAHAEHEAHSHGAGIYFKVGFILFVLTALEVLLYEVCYGSMKEMAPGLGTALSPWFVALLLGLSAVKFWLVAMFYMHLRDDMKFLSWTFGFSLALAATVIVALITLFVYNRGLWWFDGVPWK